MKTDSQGRCLIKAKGISAGYGDKTVLEDIDLRLHSGELLGVVGPNGCGKSTLLRTLTGRLAARSGSIQVMGQALTAYSRMQFARKVAVVPQADAPPFDFTANELVLQGRRPHWGFLSGPGAKDRAKALQAMQTANTVHLKHRSIRNLSSGEFQRVLVARALAQDCPILLLDEPTAHLDVGHEVEVFRLLHQLCRAEGVGILCICHNLNAAAAYCDRLVLLDQGRIKAEGNPQSVLTLEQLREVYAVDLSLTETPDGRGRPQFLYHCEDL
ncbi:MAG: ABC transporter ATP-binding protein [Opitutales bacterium]|nr:ABC transporter ATP-binding protein [Opitutales bacterium]